MPNTYTQIHLQFVFSPKYRAALINPSWEDELYKYITAIVQSERNRHKLLAINGMPDHIHIFIGMRPDQSVSQLMQEIKSASSRWINDGKKVKGKFEWQSGYGGFSYSKSDVQKVISYIRNQKKHHSKKEFLVEYKELLREFEVEYNEQYIFHSPV